jgi:hypothetical protein
VTNIRQRFIREQDRMVTLLIYSNDKFTVEKHISIQVMCDLARIVIR